MYLGVGVMPYVNKPEVLARPDICEDFYERCRSFLQVAALEVKKRWDFSDPVLSKIGILNPIRALNTTSREAYPSIISLVSALPRVMPETQLEKLQALDDEWRRLPLVNLPVEISNEDTFSGKLKKWENPCGEKEFAHLPQFALDALCLSHSNANCERVFSKVNLIKTKTRNRLLTETINGSLLATQCAKEKGDCIAFTPTEGMLSRMTTGTLYQRREEEEEDFPFVFDT